MDFSCKAQYTGTGKFVRCLEEDKAQGCSYAEPLGNTYFCKSPQCYHFYNHDHLTIKKKPAIQDEVKKARMIS